MADRVADELEIRNLIARLAHLADHGEVDDYVACFTDDALWEMPGAPRHGARDIRAGSEERRSTGGTGPGSNTRHAVSTIVVDIESPDRATSDSYWQFWVDTVDAPRLQLMGHYRDTFARTPDGWKLARRTITFG